MLAQQTEGVHEYTLLYIFMYKIDFGGYFYLYIFMYKIDLGGYSYLFSKELKFTS